VTAPVFIMTPRTLELASGAQTVRIGDMLTLTGTEARHAVTVRRLQVGERVDLVDGAGLRLVCEVVRAGANGARECLGRFILRLISHLRDVKLPDESDNDCVLE